MWFVCSCRQQLSTVERSRQKFKAAPLTVEFVPFFYRKSLSVWINLVGHVVFIYCSNLLFIIWPSAMAHNQRSLNKAASVFLWLETHTAYLCADR